MAEVDRHRGVGISGGHEIGGHDDNEKWSRSW